MDDISKNSYYSEKTTKIKSSFHENKVISWDLKNKMDISYERDQFFSENDQKEIKVQIEMIENSIFDLKNELENIKNKISELETDFSEKENIFLNLNQIKKDKSNEYTILTEQNKEFIDKKIDFSDISKKNCEKIVNLETKHLFLQRLNCDLSQYIGNLKQEIR